MAQNEQGAPEPQIEAREPAERDKKPRDMESRPRERRHRDGPDKKGGPGRKDGDRKGPQEKKASDVEEKVLFINRTSKVVTGGRKFSFAALTVVGDGKGRIGFGIGKAPELADAIRKSGEQARKRMVTFNRAGDTIPHEVNVKYDGARVLLKPAAPGSGIVAGSRVRSVLTVAGLKDVVGKSLGSTNPFNLVRATFKALSLLTSKAQVMSTRGIQL